MKSIMNKILVSIVIPTYNRTDYVEEAILSAISQTYNNTEIILCDDNALKPEVRKYIISVAEKYPQVKLVLNKENLGGSLNRNEGIKAAKGELISFLDDDDVYAPTRIEKVVEKYLENKDNKIGIIYTYCHACNSDLSIKGEFCNTLSDNPLFQHMCDCLCPTSQWTVPAQVFKEVGMFEDALCKQDSIMLLKILGANYKALCVEEKLSYFRLHSGTRISSSFKTHITGEKYFQTWLKKYYHLLNETQIHKVEANLYKRLLVNYAGIGNRSSAFSCIMKIIKNKQLPTLKDILYVVFGPNLLKTIKYKIKGFH